jgi:D-alanyl-D-alanine carboxypeptidase
MSNPWRKDVRKTATGRSALAISLAISLLALGSMSPASATDPEIPPPTKPCSKPCFDPPTYSIDKASSVWVVVNKIRPLSPITYVPKLAQPKFSVKGQNPYGLYLAPEAATALEKLFKDALAAKAGTLILQSAYRSYNYQGVVYDRQVKRLGKTAGEALAARPGYSEHQTGLAADIGAVGQGCLIQTCFAQTKAGAFLRTQGYKYGFILRYPWQKTPSTGYQYEPWHMRYVGVALATEMRKRHIKVLEDFWSLPAAPNY